MAEMFPNSAATWESNRTETVAVPSILTAPRVGGPIRRIKALNTRTDVRIEMALENYELSRKPKRGLPVSDDKRVYRFVGQLLAERKTLAILLLGANVVMAFLGLVVPQILGQIMDLARTDQAALAANINRLVLIGIGVTFLQAGFTLLARMTSAIFGNDILASAREQIVRTVLQLPLSRVETASTGDLVTRVTRDVSSMANSARWALPHSVTSIVRVTLIIIALVLNSWLLATPLVIMILLMWFAWRRYIRVAPPGYIKEGATYAQINSTLTETVEGARTVEAFGLRKQRIAQTDEDLEAASQAERLTMTLRNELFLLTGFGAWVPMAILVVLAAWGYSNSWVTLGQITIAVLYLQQITEPFGFLLWTMNQLQIGIASTSRLLGIAEVPPDRESTDEKPADHHLVGKDLRFAYRDGRDVLHGIDIDLVPGERLAIVGPSGSGKSTMSRLLAGINAPRTGIVEVGGVDVMHLPLDELRREVALVTQEHHVFVGSIRDNIALAREKTATDEMVWDALTSVQADDWIRRLPDGLDTQVGSGRYQLTPAQAQQIALARLVVADPKTLVLDEATSLIDPHQARSVEGSMASLLDGRTVIAIAHRLHTAHDADRIAVVIDGKIAELGTHHELLAQQGEYAALWSAWTN